MDTKVSLEIHIEKPEALSTFSDDLKTIETESKFVIVPTGDAFNLDPGTIAVLVSFFENGGIEFVRFLVDKIFKCFDREEIKFIEIRNGDNPPVRILSNMSEDKVVKILQRTLGVSHDSSH